MSADLKFTTDLDDTGFARGIKGMSASLKQFSQLFAAAFAGNMVTRGIAAIIEHTDKVNDLSSSLSLTTQEFQRFAGVFALSGVESEKFAAGMAKLNNTLEDARQGNAKAIESFTRLGLTMSQIERGTSGEILMAMSEGLKTATNRTEAMAAAFDILGNKQVKLVGALTQGSEAIEEQGAKIQTVSDANLAAVDRLGDAFTMLKNSAMSLGAEGLGGTIKFADRHKSALEAIGKAALLASPAVARLAADLQKMNAGPAVVAKAAFQDMDIIPGLNASGVPGQSFRDTDKDSALERAVKTLEDSRAAEEGKAIADALDEQAKAARELQGHLQNAAEIRREMFVDTLNDAAKLKFLEKERALIVAKATKAAGLERAELIEKLALKDQEIQKEKALQDEKKRSDRESMLREKLSAATSKRDSALERQLEFGMMSPDQRRESVRRQRETEVEKRRQARIESRGGQDARFGAGQIQKEIALNEATIQNLAKELAKLIPQ